MKTTAVPSARKIMANAAQTIKGITLELGGNDPAILLEDADLGDAAMERMAKSVYRMTGQVCMAIKRIYVPESIKDKFLDAFTRTVDKIVVGDGTLGYEPQAPYDVILVSAAAPQVPQSLVAQLAIGGRLVLPVGSRDLQELVLICKEETGVRQVRLDGCAFVPLIGEEGFSE